MGCEVGEIAGLHTPEGDFATPPEACEVTRQGAKAGSCVTGQALAMLLPGIGSASAARHAGASKVSAKYCVSCTTSS